MPADDPITGRPVVFDYQRALGVFSGVDPDPSGSKIMHDVIKCTALAMLSTQLDRMIALLEELVYEEGPDDGDGGEPVAVRDEWPQMVSWDDRGAEMQPNPPSGDQVIHFPRRDRPA